MKVKFFDNINYQTFPETDDMIDIDEILLKEIGVTKQYVNGEFIEYDGLKKSKRILEIKKRLNELNQDFIQVMCGAVIDDFEERKLEFQELHNELRVLEGKEERVYVEGESL